MASFRRRRFLLFAGALVVAPIAGAQARLPLLGILSPHRKPAAKFISDNPFTNRLRTLGWVEGENLMVERAYAEGREALLGELAASLVRKPVDVIWAVGVQATQAAARASTTIPIVFWGVPGPVERGLASSLARPGKNVTGVEFSSSAEMDAKRIQLLREIAPHARRLAWIMDPNSMRDITGDEVRADSLVDSAQRLGFELREFAVKRPEDFDSAFAAIADWRAHALYTYSATLTFRERHRIVAFANRMGIPSVYTEAEFVNAGGLSAYGLVLRPTLERCADYIDRILRGAAPRDLPIELPSTYELVVNLKTAKTLGLAVPQTVLLRADRVIE